MSLLSQAKSVASIQNRNESEADAELVELALAYVRHEINATQVAAALGISKSSANQKMVAAVFSAIRTGQIS